MTARLVRILAALGVLLGPALLAVGGLWAGDLPQGVFAGKRVLFINSYYPGYVWSDGIEHGAREVLEGAGITFKSVALDANRLNDKASLREAGRQAKAELDVFAPDVVIAADDPAQESLVVPYLKDGPIPVVFCGVNWDASVYGYPTPAITGMIEVDLVEEAVKQFKHYAKGDRIGYLTPNVMTGIKNLDYYNKRFFAGKMKGYTVSTFQEFKDAFARAQNEVDMLLILNEDGISGWNPAEAEAFMLKAITIPTGGFQRYMAPYQVFTFAKMPEEQGTWAAHAVLRILVGEPPSAIPMAENTQAHLTVNLKMAAAAGIVLPVPLLKTAEVIGRE